MTLDDIIRAPARISARPGAPGLQGQAYLRTYPYVVALARSAESPDGHFELVACATYGWMRRALRLEAPYLAAAREAFARVRSATDPTSCIEPVEAMAKCLRSRVGASKVAHFANPSLCPIWDSKVEGLRTGTTPDDKHMQSLDNYVHYAEDVWAIAKDTRFPDFSRSMLAAMRSRFEYLEIPFAADVSPLRIIDLAAFEISGGGGAPK